MQRQRLARCLFYPALLLFAGAGCQSLHSYRPMPVSVHDKETDKPIAGVEVRVSYPMANSNFAPFESTLLTEADGIARVRAAPYHDIGVMVELTAKGYMPEQTFLTTEKIQALAAAGWFEDVSKRHPALEVGMFAEPHPTIELVLPSAYRGLVKVKIRAVESNIPIISSGGPSADAIAAARVGDRTATPTIDGKRIAPGQRMFRYAVPTSGEIVITGDLLFRHVIASDLRFSFADGIPLTPKATDSALGYWWIKCEQEYNYFLVGTQRDCDDFRRANSPRQIGGPNSRGAKQSRWNRDPNQTPPASSPPGITDVQQGMLNSSARERRPTGPWPTDPNP